MRRVVIESPYSGGTDLNMRYLSACLRDCILRGETPYASHGLLTLDGVLTNDQSELDAGMMSAHAWIEVADAVVVYTDLGLSRKMRADVQHAARVGCTVEYRSLGGAWIDDLVEMAKANFRALGVAVPCDAFIRDSITKGLTP